MKFLRLILHSGGISLLLIATTILAGCSPKAKETPVPTLALSAWLSTSTPEPPIEPMSMQENAPATLAAEAPEPTTPQPDPPADGNAVLFLLPAQLTPDQQNTLDKLKALAARDGFEAVERPSADLNQIPAGTKRAVIIGGWSGADALVAGHAETPFLAFDAPGLAEAPNLTQVSPRGLSPEQVDFTAGYIAAVISTHWRIGVIHGAERAPVDRFVSGAVFFCGLCRSPYPPFVAYPVQISLSGEQGIPEAVAELKQSEVKTVYVAPGSESSTLYQALAEAGINIISTQRAPEGLRDHWAVSIISASGGPALEDTWQAFIQQESTSGGVHAQPAFQDINPAVFSNGRQMLVESMLNEMNAGTIQISSDPS